MDRANRATEQRTKGFKCGIVLVPHRHFLVSGSLIDGNPLLRSEENRQPETEITKLFNSFCEGFRCFRIKDNSESCCSRLQRGYESLEICLWCHCSFMLCDKNTILIMVHKCFVSFTFKSTGFLPSRISFCS